MDNIEYTAPQTTQDELEEAVAMEPIAVVGMACRVPGARDIDQFWHNLANAVESISFYSDEQLLQAGVAQQTLDQPDYVKARGELGEIDQFDAAFFDFTPNEAKVMDPQHRVMLEVAWTTFEHAGYQPQSYDGDIGVYIGVSYNSYFLENLLNNPEQTSVVNDYRMWLNNDKDFVPTWISYKLNLTGPSLNVNTACSSSLVAVQSACQSLWSYQCDMALAGGVSIRVPHRRGYIYQPGAILSPDGHCRAFDAQAQGTVGGDGAGLVLLKRLEEAQQDGDTIHGVILSAAINNDGANKIGYTAPSIVGQAKAIADAHMLAAIPAESISYIEAHGTGTELGDPIEISALVNAFDSEQTNFCAIGSVKTNIGHLDSAAGVVGLIKTILALKHQQIPASLHYQQPNAKIDFANSPFYVNQQLTDWHNDQFPLRAGVSSFGIGGTNAHVVLEQPPEPEHKPCSEATIGVQPIVLSAKTATALQSIKRNLAAALTQNAHNDNCDAQFADIAYTLACGRESFAHREVWLCNSKSGFLAAMEQAQTANYQHVYRQDSATAVTLLLPDMPATPSFELYQTFYQALYRHNGCYRDLVDALLPNLAEQEITQPPNNPQLQYFVYSYALVQLWQRLGVMPTQLIAEGIGELVAACLTDHLSIDQALNILAPHQMHNCAIDSDIDDTQLADFYSLSQGQWLSPDATIDWAALAATKTNHSDLTALATQISADDSQLLYCGWDIDNEQLSQQPLPYYAVQRQLLSTMSRLWCFGHTIDWQAWYQDQACRRIPLPTYPFERASFWIEPQHKQQSQIQQQTLAPSQTFDKANNKKPIDEWFYRQHWDKQALTETKTSSLNPSGHYLLFIHPAAFSDQLVNALNAQADNNSQLITVLPGPAGQACQQTSTQQFSLDISQAQSYQWLFKQLEQQQLLPRTILHLWSLDHHYQATNLENYQRQQQLGFYSLMHIAQALGSLKQQQDTQLLSIANHLHAITEHDQLTCGKSTIIGALNVIPMEYHHIQCQCIELACYNLLDDTTIIQRLLGEIQQANAAPIVSLRQTERLVQQFIPTTLIKREQPKVFKSQGVYLITGGLGGIGLAIAQHLATENKLKLALVSRRELPHKSQWPTWLQQHDSTDSTTQIITQLQAIEALGSEVLVLQADVAHQQQMQAAITQAEQHLGPIDGLIHSAGIAGGGMIQPRTPAQVEQVFAAKVQGTLVLQQVLSHRQLDVVVLCSSLNAIFGTVGQIDYCAANAFIDAFANSAQFNCHNRFCINWDVWKEVGMAYDGLTPQLKKLRQAELQHVGMSNQEALAAFDRIMASNQHHVYMSTHELQARLEKSQHFDANSLQHIQLQPATAPRPELATAYQPPQGDTEQLLLLIWQQSLGFSEIGRDDSFFELGGDSLLGLQLIAQMNQQLKLKLQSVDLYEMPTIKKLADYISGQNDSEQQQSDSPQMVSARFRHINQAKQQLTTKDNQDRDIAIIGMSARLPGSKDLAQFWQNLCEGVESIKAVSDEELQAQGFDSELISQPNFVKVASTIDDIDLFDGNFFGFSPREAEIIAPDHRLFIESSYHALEHAGYVAEKYQGQIGVYAGSGLNTYLMNNLYPSNNVVVSAGIEKEFIATNVSYRLNLTGPSVNVQSFCSTSLVAVHSACQALRHGECDMALAGGVTIRVPSKSGYLYQQGGILSADGHCRAFDADASGTVFGSGLGVVVLKRLSHALNEGDYIHAVIKGSAINNDGSDRASFNAPGISGQSQVIEKSLADANVPVESISYVEAHGTGTNVGDPIEFKALSKAYRQHTDKRHFCALGSLKTNIGHLDAASGIAGLIKTTLAMQHQQLPATLHYQTPNPGLGIEDSPFYINHQLNPWSSDSSDNPLRAGISSFGIGGTNAHVIIEQAPKLNHQVDQDDAREHHLLMLSGRTSEALATLSEQLRTQLKQQPKLNLADVAYTLQRGRRDNKHRRFVLVKDNQQALELLQNSNKHHHLMQSGEPDIAFLFSGQGAQYINMAADLYQAEPTFRYWLNRLSDSVKSQFEFDLIDIIYPHDNRPQASELLSQTRYTQPALFVIEYALAQLLMEWGIKPKVMMGHSLGEYVAASLAGVMAVEDALKLVCIRGRLMQSLPTGSMLLVTMAEQPLMSFIAQQQLQLSLAAVNGPLLSVVSGDDDNINRLQTLLQQQNTTCQRLHTSHAFHSHMMEPIIDQFKQQLEAIELKPAKHFRYISNVSGDWIKDHQATNPQYWVDHLRQAVRFNQGLELLLTQPEQILIEVGPGSTLATLSQRHPAKQQSHVICHTIPHPNDQQPAQQQLLTTLGQLWLHGVNIDWQQFYRHEQRKRVPLPVYPFERTRYWIAADSNSAMQPQAQDQQPQKLPVTEWFHTASWKRVALPLTNASTQTSEHREQKTILLFTDNLLVDANNMGSQLAQQLSDTHNVIIVSQGQHYHKQDAAHYQLPAADSNAYSLLFDDLAANNLLPQTIVHLWNITAITPLTEFNNKDIDHGFYSVLYLAQAIGKLGHKKPLQLLVVSNGLHQVTGSETVAPEKTTVLGPVRVIPQEFEHFACRSIDIVLPQTAHQQQQLVKQLYHEVTIDPELVNQAADTTVALRGNFRWLQDFAEHPLEASDDNQFMLRHKGVYLVTGGLGGIGYTLAEYLAKSHQARLVLLGRSAIPARSEWQDYLDHHDETDGTVQRINKIQQLEQLGAQVLALNADVSSKSQMQQVIEQSQQQFGMINGVIHAAGVPSGGLIQLKTPEMVDSILQPKIQGSMVLAELLGDKALDFLVLCSSLTGSFGEVGQVDYAAANSFVDAYTHTLTQQGVPAICINWDGWQDVGMSVYVKMSQEQEKLRQKRLKLAIAPDEGVDAFVRILHSRQPQIFISPHDFKRRIERIHASTLADSEIIKVAATDNQTYSRPELSEPYIEPTKAIDSQIANVWQQLLGIDKVGIKDNFFELGGDSLVGIQLINNLNQQFNAKVSVVSLYERPTVESLAGLYHTEPEKPQADALSQSISRGKLRRNKRTAKKRIQ